MYDLTLKPSCLWLGSTLEKKYNFFLIELSVSFEKYFENYKNNLFEYFKSIIERWQRIHNTQKRKMKSPFKYLPCENKSDPNLPCNRPMYLLISHFE